jgi:hypothetical protein
MYQEMAAAWVDSIASLAVKRLAPRSSAMYFGAISWSAEAPAYSSCGESADMNSVYGGYQIHLLTFIGMFNLEIPRCDDGISRDQSLIHDNSLDVQTSDFEDWSNIIHHGH